VTQRWAECDYDRDFKCMPSCWWQQKSKTAAPKLFN
jgi:hypothetical protein